MGPNTATESPRRVTACGETSPCPTRNWIATVGRAPAHVGRSVSGAMRVFAPGFSSSSSSDRKSVVEGKSVDLGGRRIIKKKKKETLLRSGLKSKVRKDKHVYNGRLRKE